jgi:hypothetical protein
MEVTEIDRGLVIQHLSELDSEKINNFLKEMDDELDLEMIAIMVAEKGTRIRDYELGDKLNIRFVCHLLAYVYVRGNTHEDIANSFSHEVVEFHAWFSTEFKVLPLEAILKSMSDYVVLSDATIALLKKIKTKHSVEFPLSCFRGQCKV